MYRVFVLRLQAIRNQAGWRQFETSQANGRGVYGYASNTGDNVNFGGNFRSDGEQGVGVYGYASNSGDVKNYGGHFIASGEQSTGVYGAGKAYDFLAGGTGFDYGSSSSIRWKRNIQVIDNPLDKILRLRGVYFNWDDEHGGGHDVGMIAEEVGEVLPEIVGYEENGIDAIGMDYSKLTPLLVEAVKALKQQADEQKSELAENKAEIARLKDCLSKLEAGLDPMR